ncbi:MAG TPA: hypothetical protein VGC76_18865 [Pyrinomonadaceae bacterium]|jgi:hypothetical protein
MLRKLIAKFNKSLTERVVSTRHNYEVPIKIWIEPDRITGKLQKSVEYLSISGETKDLSKTGIAFVVSAIRLREYYLVGENRTLNAELDLPGGKILMQIVGQRYEQVGQHISEARFLIGAAIQRMSREERDAYEEFLQYGKKRGKTKGLALGIDKG